MNAEQLRAELVDRLTTIVRAESSLCALVTGVDAVIGSLSCDPSAPGDLHALAADLRVRAEQASSVALRLGGEAAKLETLGDVLRSLPLALPSEGQPVVRKARAKARAVRKAR